MSGRGSNCTQRCRERAGVDGALFVLDFRGAGTKIIEEGCRTGRIYSYASSLKGWRNFVFFMFFCGKRGVREGKGSARSCMDKR